MKPVETTQNQSKIEDEFHCKYCKKFTGKRSYLSLSKHSIFAYIFTLFMYPFMCCCTCFCLPFQNRRVFCMNCNAEVLDDEEN